MTKAMHNPKAPHMQEFNRAGSKCKSKSRSWWNPNSPTYWAAKKDRNHG